MYILALIWSFYTLIILDNSPVCPLPEYEVALSEAVAIGSYVLTVEAHDPDLGELIFKIFL